MLQKFQISAVLLDFLFTKKKKNVLRFPQTY